ncbi:XPG domain containing-domain-containing protein [Jimgerdemannia flammicorona]|uniref:XPG domain containing-domain-containing protein n=1 Tax=Jimgerdemannia flammicorona TaxID=994334 RepID=A0A433Q2K7_9FUNG|nr:XPG domain containing-domain-containing protein [Jimgerdemannia flammicorona]
MGIKGLHSYIQQTPSLAHTKEWPLHPDSSPAVPHRLVIDGNAYVHHLYSGSLDWVHGGQYTALATLLRLHTSTLQQAGFDLLFLFDGPLPLHKRQNRLARDTEKIDRVTRVLQILDRTSRTPVGMGGQSPKLRHLFLLPPLALDVTLQTLRSLPGVRVSVCAGEADGAVARLARQKGAYAVSKDSDYFVHDVGPAGYIPLDTLHVPLDPREGNVITATVYHPSEVAAHLGFLAGHLPLFASLVGNDYIEPHVFEAEILAYAKKAGAAARQAGVDAAGGSAFGRIKATAKFVKQFKGWKKEEEVVDHVIGMLGRSAEERRALVESMRQYNPKEEDEDAPIASVPHRVVTAFHEGRFGFKLMDVVVSGSFWCTQFLEDIERESAWAVGKELRKWMYAVLWAQVTKVNADTEPVTEYIRRGDHLAPEPTIPILVPAHLQADPRRLLLHALHADTPTTRAMPPVHALLAATLRYLVHHAANSASPKSTPHKLANHEILAFVVVGLRDTQTHINTAVDTKPAQSPSRRGLHLAAQFQFVLACAHLLAQALFPGVDGRGEAEVKGDEEVQLALLYDGLAFHRVLALARDGTELDMILTSVGVERREFEAVMGAVEDGLLAAGEIEVAVGFGDAGKTPLKKAKTKKERAKVPAGVAQGMGGNMFEVLSFGCEFDE